MKLIAIIKAVRPVVSWLRNGATGAAPQFVKHLAIRYYITKYNIKTFVETGTYLGDTTAMVASTGITCKTIELSEDFANRARERFAGHNNVEVIQGDSGACIAGIVAKLDGVTLFWLDGHYSGGNTAKASIDTPIASELRAILGDTKRTHVILVDDARLFDGTDSYPELHKILEIAEGSMRYKASVSSDIIRIEPRVLAT